MYLIWLRAQHEYLCDMVALEPACTQLIPLNWMALIFPCSLWATDFFQLDAQTAAAHGAHNAFLLAKLCSALLPDPFRKPLESTTSPLLLEH